MVQSSAPSARHARPARRPRQVAGPAVVRMGGPEQLGFTVSPDSVMMNALASGDMATRTAARAHFTIVTARS